LSGKGGNNFKNMIKQNFVIICESAVIAENSKTLNLFGIFENINTSGVPLVYPKFCVVTKFEGDTGEHKHEIVIRYERDMEEIARLEGEINFVGKKKVQYIGTFLGFPFKYFGKYIIEIYIDNILQPLTGDLNVIEKK